jgi:phosphatidylserine/phosphatidylglycerophosphate/cardiolipin synthase-like enzyme
VAYGLTPDLEAGIITISELNSNHTITIDNLQANEFYYVKPFSVFDSDTTIGNQFIVATASTSTGEMHCYFNHSVNTDVAWQESTQATGSSDFTDTIISYINKSENTLDITMYDIIDTSENEVTRIMAAINEAYDRGVSVRYITDDTPENPLLESLYEEIPVLRGNSEAIMHNKFMIVDGNSIENSWVLTGSTNHTTANLSKDYNNIICIQDHQLAKAYELEFNEMWGSSNLSPNPAEALFGADKTNNTPHVFSINGIRVESYFSPSDNTTRQISQVIDNASETVHFGVLVFTEDVLGAAILNAHNRGLTINGIADYVDYPGDEFHMLLNEGVDVVDYINEDGSEWPIGATFHHKYAIIDQATDQAVLITGSHNWSASAESRNDENTLIIYDRRMANMYYQEFAQRFAEQKALLGINENELRQSYTIYPNPSANTFTIDMEANTQNFHFRIIDLQGRVAQEGQLTSGKTVTHNLPQGLYFVQIKSDKGTKITKLMVK